jgi:hypothetical protein
MLFCLFSSLLQSSGDKMILPCMSWKKFLLLTDLLDYSLYDIADALSTHQCSVFTSKEMIQLIGALFEESPKRQALLESIQQMQVQTGGSVGKR